jgi:hypothetical protein
MRYSIILRHFHSPKARLFKDGLEALGYKASEPRNADVLVIWNRYGGDVYHAQEAEARGAKVLIAENATWGNEFAGKRWYSLWPTLHNRASSIRPGGPDRWDSLGVTLEPWRNGPEVIGLPQRGIGPRAIAMPSGWTPPGCTRIRKHPGKGPCKPLEEDLAQAGRVVTWGSGAAVKALAWGIPVDSHMPDWCAEQDNTDSGRLAMFQRLAWAQFTHAEIASGEAFRCVL